MSESLNGSLSQLTVATSLDMPAKASPNESPACSEYSGRPYLVEIRGKPFELSSTQIQFDSPNFFTLAFSEDWQESKRREVKISDRDPELFRTCLQHLLSI